jgi:hypothetical protein
LIKYSQAFVARTWNQYSEQGPEHEAVMKFWTANHQDIPGDWDPSYFSWVKWYNERKRTDWGEHKDPKFVLQELKSEIEEPKEQEPEKRQDPDRRRGLRRLLPFKSKGTYKVKDGADLSTITPEVASFLDLLGAEAASMGAEVPVVTSGYRSPNRQARVMARNWDRNGGPRGGTEYLISLYANDKMAQDIGSIFYDYGSGRKGQAAAAQYLTDNNISSHMVVPTQVVDLRMTKGISEVIDSLRQKGIEMKAIDEKDHFHIKVYSVPNSLNRLASLYRLIG